MEHDLSQNGLNLEKGPDPLSAVSAAQVLFPRAPSPLPYQPQVPPIGASALAPGGSRSWGHQGLGKSDPGACLLSWAGKTCLGAGHTLPGTEVPAGAMSQEP